MQKPPRNIVVDWLNTIWTTELPPHSKYLACYLRKFMNAHNDMAYPGYERMESETGLSRATIAKYLEILEKEGWIARERGGRNKSTRYIAVFPKTLESKIKSLGDELYKGGKSLNHDIKSLADDEKSLGAKQELNKRTKQENKYSPDDKRLAEYIYQRVLIVAPKAKAPNIGKWASVIRLMRERDNLNYREIAEVFTWANSHHFWQTNILSPEKLRNQFATLHAQKEGENENTQNPINRKLSAVDEVRAAIRKREESRAAASRDHGAVMAETIGDVRESLYKPVRGRANGELGEAIEGDYTRPDSDGPKPPNELDF